MITCLDATEIDSNSTLSIEILMYIDDMNDNNDTLLRYADEYDIISILNDMKMSSYLNHHYVSAQ